MISRNVFERLPHLEDEVAYLFQARIFARGDIVIESPQPRRAFWQPFVLDYTPSGSDTSLRFGKYTPGWPLLLSIGVNLGQMWVMNAFFAGLTVALVYRFGREVFNRDVGLIAAGLTAFSPAALLLNATLMGHTAALFFTTLFVFAYWRMERQTFSMRWGIVAGIALGIVIISRPLTAVGVALPFILWSGSRLGYALWKQRDRWLSTLKPMIALGVIALLIATAIPIFNNAATHNPTHNLYTLVWDYDRIGFGECCGRSGHTLEKAIRHTRFDLSLTGADLFGWQFMPITDEMEQHWLQEGDYYPGIGWSFILLPFGLVLGAIGILYRHKLKSNEPFWVWLFKSNPFRFTVIWLIVAVVWILIPLKVDNALISEADNSRWWWLWLGGCTLWLGVPPAFGLMTRQSRTFGWTWLILAVPLAIVLVQFTYWIGSQRYSTRYYFEGLTMVAIISAIPIAWLIQRLGRVVVYGAFALLLCYTLLAYSLPRIGVLHGFNFITQAHIDEIEARRDGDQPVLVLLTGDSVRWRAIGPLMAVTSPYLDSEIVGAWDYGGVRDVILANFPGWQVIEMDARDNFAWFLDEPCVLPDNPTFDEQQEYDFCLQRPSRANVGTEVGTN